MLDALAQPAIDWATAHGPPNWLFVLALLTTPHLWSRYIKRAAGDLYSRYLTNSNN